MKTLIAFLLCLPLFSYAQDHTPPLAPLNLPILVYQNSDFFSIQHFYKPIKCTCMYNVEVKMTIHSEAKQVKRFNFSYDNEISISVNGENIYINNRLRDNSNDQYIFIPLRKGNNNVKLEGHQRPGSVGIRGQWEDMEGIAIVM